jgi:hypothetical protein
MRRRAAPGRNFLHEKSQFRNAAGLAFGTKVALYPVRSPNGDSKRSHDTMNIRNFTFSAIALAMLGMLAAPNQIAAQPLNDRVEVNLPYSVTIGDKILQPGNYTIQQLDSSGANSPVLLIYGDNGMKFETSAMTISALENRTQSDTRVILHHIGNDYYFDKIWIQGKDYGYEFVLPNNVKQRENEASQPVSVTASASSMPAAPAPPAAAAEPAPAPEPVPAPEPAPAAVQAETPPNTANREMTEPAPAPAPELTPSPAADETPTMPHTDAGWLIMLLSGGTLTGVGASLRRKR